MYEMGRIEFFYCILNSIYVAGIIYLPDEPEIAVQMPRPES